MAMLMGLVGCGSGVNEALFQTANAAGRTVLDLFLTELANGLAGGLDETAAPPPDDSFNGMTNGDAIGDGGDGLGADGSSDELTPDPDAGLQVYSSNGCASCHCDNAGGGCALEAPGLLGVQLDALGDSLRGDSTHPVSSTLSDQDLVDLEAYLASL
jgi:mono/diheme cytochrome c family protein